MLTCAAVAEATPQTRPTPPQDIQPAQRQDAMETRRELQLILRQSPPSLVDVLRLDPSLLTNREYLAPYPALSEFLVQHSEVAHNPSYFLGVGFRPQDNRQDIAIIFIMSAFLCVFTWLIKTSIDYRRWARVFRVQEDLHSKLLGRFTSNEDLLGYLQTPAGKKLFESNAIVEGQIQSVGAPLGRILWSTQAGLVLMFGGIGLYYASINLSPDYSNEAFFIVSILAIALGIGFIEQAILKLPTICFRRRITDFYGLAVNMKVRPIVAIISSASPQISRTIVIDGGTSNTVHFQ
jgi:hypothetical protein